MGDRLPRGPGLPKAVQAVAYHRDPLGVLRRSRARLGPVFTLRFPLKDPLVIAAVPEALPALLGAGPERAHAGAGRRLILPQASPRSPFGGDEDAHAESRKRMWPAFAPERIETIEPAIHELAEHHVSRWPVGRPFRLLEAMRSLCTDITVRLILGVSEDQRRAAIVAAIRSMLNTPGNPPLPLPGSGDDGAVGRTADRAFALRTAKTRRLLTEELRDRRARDANGNDVLSAMLASEPPLTDDQIVDELLIVLAAAQEPPSIALTNVLYELAGRPAVEEQFLSEPGMRRAIVAEVIRLRPSASAALRKLTEPMQIDGRTLPAGTVVAAPSLLLHRDPEAFNEPDVFIADRFAEGVPDGAPYLPFGGGARRCIGEALAEAEFRTVLPTALGRLRFTRAWPREERMVVRATVLVPDRSAVVTAHARDDRRG
jgi:cytochrome P450 family 135